MIPVCEAGCIASLIQQQELLDILQVDIEQLVVHAGNHNKFCLLHLAINLMIGIGSDREPKIHITADGLNAHMSPETAALTDLILILRKQVVRNSDLILKEGLAQNVSGTGSQKRSQIAQLCKRCFRATFNGIQALCADAGRV